MIIILNLDNTIPVEEVASLLGSDVFYVRARVSEGNLPGFCGKAETRRVFKIPRIAFYKKMGWETDEEIRHAYKMAGIELKEKIDLAESIQD